MVLEIMIYHQDALVIVVVVIVVVVVEALDLFKEPVVLHV